MRRNEILLAAFEVSKNDNHPPAPAAIAIGLEYSTNSDSSLKSAIESVAENFSK